jgi:uncharacterized protein
MENPIRWFEIYVQDMPRAKKFYETVLGIKLGKLDGPGPGIVEMYSFPSQEGAPGATGALAKMENGPGNGNGVIIYFGCKNCAVEAGRVADAGGRIAKPKFSIGKYGHIALATDTEGNMFGLHSMD